MSQAKVEKYKEQKANRKQTMKKEKLQSIVRNSIAAVVIVAALGWVGYSGVTSIPSYLSDWLQYGIFLRPHQGRQPY